MDTYCLHLFYGVHFLRLVLRLWKNFWLQVHKTSQLVVSQMCDTEKFSHHKTKLQIRFFSQNNLARSDVKKTLSERNKIIIREIKVPLVLKIKHFCISEAKTSKPLKVKILEMFFGRITLPLKANFTATSFLLNEKVHWTS